VNLVFEQLGPNDAAGSFISNIRLSRVINPNYSVFVSASDCSGIDGILVNKSTFDCSNLGANTVVLSVKDASGNETQQNVTVTVDDVTPPVITCPTSITINTTPGQCTGIATFATPTATDNCGTPTITQTAGLPSGSAFPIGTTTVTFQAKDAGTGGTLAATGAPGINFNYVASDDNQTVARKACEAVYGVGGCSLGQCGYFYYYYKSTHLSCNCSKGIGSYEFIYRNDGYTTVGSDYGGAATSVSGNQLFSRVKTSSTCDANAWTLADNNLRDGNTGNIATCSFTVTVVDNQPPSITCPANISVIATSASGAVVNYTAPSGSDNCIGVSNLRIAGPESGSTFPIGTTTITYRATDAAGLTTDCSFSVTVSGQAPVINCPTNIVINNTPGQCGANVGFTATETTGIPASTITYSHQPGSSFPVGTTTVTATAINAVGTSICTFTVTVVDNEVPVFGNTVSKVAVLGGNSANMTTYLNANGFTATNFSNTIPSAAVLAGYDAVVLSRINGNSVIENFVRNGGYLITEWSAAGWALNSVHLLDATETGSNFIATSTPVSFVNSSLGNHLANGLGNPYSNSGATEFLRIFNFIGSGITTI